MNMLKKLWKEEEGQGMTEYGLIVGLVVIMGATVSALFATELSALFGRINAKIAALLP
ncbi:Flp family type IVb pilin [Neobacillus niacini]|uniref:Flp family type IVb pilin n=1 Tax=Neobacillus niacini TaxID=86668 RepID=UPI002FFF64E5